MNNCLLISASSLIPVSSYSVKSCSFAITIKAPVFTLARSTVALTISSIDLSLNLSSPVLLPNLKYLEMTFFLPNSSNAFLSSGWKMIIIAIIPTLNVLSAIHNMVVRLNSTAANINSTITIIPLNKVHALLLWNHIIM